MRTYTTVDKSEWGPGPWQDEPDKLSWTDEATGLPCLIVRGNSGALCGYVGVPAEHPWYGEGYDDVRVEVHGGLTFANRCQPGPQDAAICHIPDAGQSDDVWWFGFDCAHAFDVTPRIDADLRKLGHEPLTSRFDDCLPSVQYRPVAYVTAEVASLAAQLSQSGDGGGDVFLGGGL